MNRREELESLFKGADIHSAWHESYDGSRHKIYPPADFAALVYDNIEYYRNEAEYWQSKAEEFKNNAKKIVYNEFEEENQKLQNQLDLSYGSFTYPEEKRRYHNFFQTHLKACRTTKITNCGVPYVKEYPTGLGVGFIVVCPICKKEEDITYVEG